MAEAATIARPYAKAAFMAARDAQSLPAWSRALAAGAGLVRDAGIAALLADPKLAAERLAQLFAGLGGAAVDAPWGNFVRLLAENKRLEVLPQIAAQFETLRAEFEHELDVRVTSATTLDEAQRAKLVASLVRRFKRNVRLSADVDPSLLGGAVIRARDLVIDGSVKGRLQRLASALGSLN